MNMNYEMEVSLGGLYIRLKSEVPLSVRSGTAAFLVQTENADVTVQVRVMEDNVALPPESCGEDLLLIYYRDGRYCYAAAKKGTKDSAAVTVYTPDFSETVFYINEKEFPGMIRTVDKILQLFPIRQLFAIHQIIMLHSSRVVINGKTLVFTAPSQTGKTTQAGLWKQYEKAEIVSNDRTLLRKMGNGFVTFGYPVDGSSPVCDNRRLPLGAVIVLRQGEDNQVVRLPALKALKHLMEQTVADLWNAEEKTAIQLLWMDLLEQYPVYLLTCRPDRGAVSCLKNQLMKDGVI